MSEWDLGFGIRFEKPRAAFALAAGRAPCPLSRSPHSLVSVSSRSRLGSPPPVNTMAMLVGTTGSLIAADQQVVTCCLPGPLNGVVPITDVVVRLPEDTESSTELHFITIHSLSGYSATGLPTRELVCSLFSTDFPLSSHFVHIGSTTSSPALSSERSSRRSGKRSFSKVEKQEIATSVSRDTIATNHPSYSSPIRDVGDALLSNACETSQRVREQYAPAEVADCSEV